MILPVVSEGEAAAIADRLRIAVHALHIQAGPVVTIPVGVPYHPPSLAAPQLQQLIARADAALRTAKEDGHNCGRTA